MNLLNFECKSGLWRLAKRKLQEQTEHEEMCFAIEYSPRPCVTYRCAASIAKLEQKVFDIFSK